MPSVRPTEGFLEHVSGNPDIDMSRAITDQYGTVRGVMAFGCVALSLGNDRHNGAAALAIMDIKVAPEYRSQGFGGKALRIICEACDALGLTSTLYARAHSRSPLNTTQLEAWYESRGFTSSPRGHFRTPTHS